MTDPNGKQYVGATPTTLERRWKRHLLKATYDKEHPLYEAMRNSNTNEWKIKALEVTRDPEREIYWMEELNTLNEGYNTDKSIYGQFTK